MSRRRNLRLPSSSDEDEDAPIPPIPNPNPNPIHSPNPNPNPNPISYPNPSSPPPSPPHEISDDDDGDAIFLDAADELPDPSPPSPNANSGHIRNPNPSVDPIDGVLKRLGLSLRREWLESCVGGLETAGLGFERLDSNGKAKLCFEQFLLADMNYCGAGILPANVSGMHQVELEGPFVLQVRVCLY